MVYAVFGTGVMVAYDLAGNRKWSRFLGPVTVKEGQTMAPVMAGRVLGVHFENVFIGMDPATGKTLWEIGHGRDLSPKMPGAPSGTPWGIPEGFFVTTRAGIRKASDGAYLCKFGALPYHGPVVADGRLWWFSDKRELHGKKLNIANGKVGLERRGVRVPLCDPESKRKISLHTGPVIHKGLAYVWDRSGTLIIIDLKAKAVVFDRNVGVGESDASPVLASRFIYLTGNNGTCVVLEQRSKKIETKPGKFIRKLIFPEVARNRLEPCRSGPIFRGDRMYLRGRKNLYCLKTSAADRERGKPVDQALEDMADDIEKSVDDGGIGLELE
jgi:outer membrane protein assembly factor BamB